MNRFLTFQDAIKWCADGLWMSGKEVDAGRWQGVPTEGKPDLTTIELMNVSFMVDTARYLSVGSWTEGPWKQLQDEIQPNLPWADDHFEERVGRIPSNPGEAYKWWPWWRGQSAAAMEAHSPGEDSIPHFTHTYQERYWPKAAFIHERQAAGGPWGIRYDYGDLDDLVRLLLNHPHTRQAYLPIFFPEDTGAVHGGRTPCTLGYHFMLRDNKLHVWYFIRSCDFVRHFRDDIYLTVSLLMWLIKEVRGEYVRLTPPLAVPTVSFPVNWENVIPGDFHFVCPSLHVHKGDLHLVDSQGASLSVDSSHVS